jgi:uncharacterized membrane protein
MEIAGEYAAPLFAIASGLAFVLMDGVVQLVELKGVQPGEIMFIRQVSPHLGSPNGICQFAVRLTSDQAITTFAVLAYILLTDPTSLHCLYPSASKSRLIWFRGVVNAAGGCENYLAVSHVAISEMITIEHFQPFFVGAMCWVWLGEKVSRRQGAACGEQFPFSLASLCGHFRGLISSLLVRSGDPHRPARIPRLLATQYDRTWRPRCQCWAGEEPPIGVLDGRAQHDAERWGLYVAIMT